MFEKLNLMNILIVSFFFILFNREERRRDLSYGGWHEPEDLFGFLGPKRLYPKAASRREGVDSSDEDNDSKDSSESPSLGLY